MCEEIAELNPREAKGCVHNLCVWSFGFCSFRRNDILASKYPAKSNQDKHTLKYPPFTAVLFSFLIAVIKYSDKST